MEQDTSEVLKRDDSSLQLTEVRKAIDVDLEAALADLFDSLVERYLPTDDKDKKLGDEDVWKKKYKEYFDRYQVSHRLSSHTVQTPYDVFSFDKAWKNEIWHCYEPVSFDLKREDTVKDKVYRWAGKIRELSLTNEEVHLTFLTSIPKRHNNLTDFVKSSLNAADNKVKVEVVMDSEAEHVAREIAGQMALHESHFNPDDDNPF